jgi:N-methylhydantoinase B
VVLSDLGDGERFGPWGWAGGRDARPNRFLYAPGTDEELNIGMFRTNLPVRRGRMLDCFQPGGGGYGDPLSRPIEYVLEDVEDGLVSVEGAAREYGVVVSRLEDGRFAADEAGTVQLRRQATGPPDSEAARSETPE